MTVNLRPMVRGLRRVTLLALSAVGAGAHAADADRPNLLMIRGDDIGYW